MPLGPSGVEVDTISMRDGQILGSGLVANALLTGEFNVNALRTLDILRKEEWLHFDTAVIDTARSRLNGVARMLGAGLRFGLDNPLGTTILQWERMSDMTDAEIDMSGVTEGERDRVTFDLQSMPIPIIHKGFELNIRHLSASRKLGQPLDTTQAEICSRKVAEQIESLLFAGSTLAVLGGSIPGLLTHTDRLTGSVTADWAGATGAQIVTDILAMTTALQAEANAMYGPYGIFVPYDAYTNMQNDYSTTKGDITILQRVMAIPGISFVEPVVDMPAGEVVMVQLSNDVAQIVDGMQPTLVQWESHGGMKFHFKVIAIMLPRIRSTKSAQSGIAHYS